MIAHPETPTAENIITERKLFWPFEKLPQGLVGTKGTSAQWHLPDTGEFLFSFDSEIPTTGEQVPDGRALQAVLSPSADNDPYYYAEHLYIEFRDPDGNRFACTAPTVKISEDGTEKSLHFHFSDPATQRDPETQQKDEKVVMANDIPQIGFIMKETSIVPNGELQNV